MSNCFLGHPWDLPNRQAPPAESHIADHDPDPFEHRSTVDPMTTQTRCTIRTRVRTKEGREEPAEPTLAPTGMLATVGADCFTDRIISTGKLSLALLALATFVAVHVMVATSNGSPAHTCVPDSVVSVGGDDSCSGNDTGHGENHDDTEHCPGDHHCWSSMRFNAACADLPVQLTVSVDAPSVAAQLATARLIPPISYSAHPARSLGGRETLLLSSTSRT